MRSALIGSWMGIGDGGATPASFMSYGIAQKSKTPENTALRAGRRARPENAAHAAGVSALLPMITLGIPGSPTAAVMLEASSSGACSLGQCF